MPRRRVNAVALAAQAMVEPGRPALLVFNDHVVRIRMRVMPLGRGGVGERIKVFDRNSRKVLLAKVEGRDLVSSEVKEGR